jgi:DNA-3-methyladenine glycosylase I
VISAHPESGARTVKSRCEWCGSDPLYVSYHDAEWGVPVHGDQRLFETLILQGAQAGLSWFTILRKREDYRRAFDRFQVKSVAAYTERDVQRLSNDPGIVRNRLKIEAAVRNARAVVEIQEKYGSLDDFIWRYVDHTPRQNAWESISQLPARTEQSDRMSSDLKKLGLSFVGPTICYAFMQAVGMVNDHTVDCYRYQEIKALAQ